MQPAASAIAPPPTWAEARLRLGQRNVGFWVLLAAGVVLFQPGASGGPLAERVAGWIGLVLVGTVLQLPFDGWGGYALPVRYGRREPGWTSWLVAWARGAVVHAGALSMFGAIALAIGGSAGPWAAAGALVLSGGLLLAAQAALVQRIVGRDAQPASPELVAVLTRAGLDPAQVRTIDASDASFAGGWTGARGLEVLLLPARWARTLDAEALHAVLVRRRLGLQSGARAQGAIAALAFNGSGVVLVTALLPGAGFDGVGPLAVFSAGMTLWSFAGLLTLPTLARSAVYALDQRAAAELGGSEALVRALERLDVDQEDEPSRDPAVETIFHPVPALESRVAALRRPGAAPAFVPWRVARLALFTSWASLSWLSRAVHCNVGRPELWALPPGD